MTGYMPTPADIEAIEQAAAVLDTYGLTVRMSCTVKTLEQDERWPDANDKAHYDEVKASSREMYALAGRLQVALEAAQLKLPLKVKS